VHIGFTHFRCSLQRFYFGQIVIGGLAGVIFLGEWEEYSGKDIGLSLIGLGFLALSLLIGFVWQDKTEKKRDYIEVSTIL
jgi:glucose uptake protein GlcU